MDATFAQLRRALAADPHDPSLQARYRGELRRLGPAQLEAHLRATPDDALAWACWAEVLEAAGDPRAELLALQLGQAPVEHHTLSPEQSALIASSPEWLGQLAENPFRHRLSWAHGYWFHVSNWARAQTPAWWERLLTHPSARFLRSLFVRWIDPAAFAHAIVTQPPPLTHLHWQEEAGPVALDAVQRALPGLRDLDLWVGGVCDDWEWPQLERLCLNACWSDQLKLDLIRAAGAGRFARLRELELWSGFDQGLEPLLGAFLERCPELRRLSLIGGDGVEGLEQLLLDAPALLRLEQLTVSGTYLKEPVARRYLARLSEREQPLRELRLNHDLLSEALQRELEGFALRFASSR